MAGIRLKALVALVGAGLTSLACRQEPPAAKPLPVDKTVSPSAPTRDETPQTAEAAVPAGDERPDAAPKPSAPTSAVEAACAQLEKIAGKRNFVATYELWRVGMEEGVPFELAYAKPDKCRLVANDPRMSTRVYFSGGKFCAFTPDDRVVALDLTETVNTILKAILNAHREREELHRTWGWRPAHVTEGFCAEQIVPEFQIKIGRSGDAERPYTIELGIGLGISLSTKQETVSFGWLAEPRSWKDAEVKRNGDVVRFLTPGTAMEVDARNSLLVRISMLEGDRVGGGVERKRLREEALPDSAFEPSPEDRLRAEQDADAFAGCAIGVLGTSWLLGPLATRLPDNPTEWPPEGREAIETYLAAVWRGLFVEMLGIDVDGWSADFAKTFLDNLERHLGRPIKEGEVAKVQEMLVDTLGEMFDAEIRKVLKVERDMAPDASKMNDKSTVLAFMSYRAIRRVIGAAIAKDIAAQMDKLLRERKKPEKATPQPQ